MTRHQELLRYHLEHDHASEAPPPGWELGAVHRAVHVFNPAVQHQHLPCPQVGCLGELVRLGAHSLRAAPFECTVCHRLQHTAACRDEQGRLECCCGLADAEAAAASSGVVAP